MNNLTEIFFESLIKTAYGYDYERKELEKAHTKHSTSKGTAGRGAVIGGVAGAAIGSLSGVMERRKMLYGFDMGRVPGSGHYSGKRGLAGALIGGAAGAGLGALAGHAHRKSVEHSKKILAMSPKERKKALLFEARRMERWDTPYAYGR